MLTLIVGILFFSCSDENNIDKMMPYPEESSAKINRGLVSLVKTEGSNFISWRKLVEDDKDQVFYLWRKSGKKIEVIAQTKQTHYIDSSIENRNQKYGISLQPSDKPENFVETVDDMNPLYSSLVYDLQTDYKQAFVVTGDLTGDGELEVLINYSQMDRVDPYEKAWMKSTHPFILTAFTKYGEKLWEFNRGLGIEAGKNYSPVVVWDLNADGKCEVILKTNRSNDPMNYEEEYISILDGTNGEIIRENKWPQPVSDDYNSNSRNYIAIAHLDGINPTIVVGRGLYHTQIIYGYDTNLNLTWERIIGSDIKKRFENKILNKIWSMISNDKSRGSHSLPIADIDENGTEEIFWGEHVITENGEDLWKIEEKIPYTGQPDIVFAADMIKNIPGKEIYYLREGWGEESEDIGIMLVSSEGKTIWSKWGYTHVDGGWAAPVISNKNDWQFFNYDIKKKIWKPGQHSFNQPNQQLIDSKGEIISYPDSSWIGSFTVDWEGDGIKEICKKDGSVTRYNDELLAKFDKGIQWAGDLWGDHREEIIYAPQDRKVYIIFNSDTSSHEPRITKLADRQYRNDLSRTAMQYNVVPTESGFKINK
ncbi:MAG: hypothetical protein R3250_13445 [Melioribacteraceae bacterium]|nr:hypothetical protein [Melioribacteraceae bacterium]